MQNSEDNSEDKQTSVALFTENQNLNSEDKPASAASPMFTEKQCPEIVGVQRVLENKLVWLLLSYNNNFQYQHISPTLAFPLKC